MQDEAASTTAKMDAATTATDATTANEVNFIVLSTTLLDK